MKNIKHLVRENPNDADLGKAIRAKSLMIKQRCKVCGVKFKGTVRINICPNCYV